MKRSVLIGVLFITACSPQASPQVSTSTTAPPDKPTVIVAVGDIACSTRQRNSGKYDCKDGEVAALTESMNPDAVLALGDIQYPQHHPDDFKYNFMLHWRRLIDRIHPIAGNHEYDMNGASGFFQSWNSIPKTGYYSFDIDADWRIVAINTNDECSYVWCKKGSDQYVWLEEELQNNRDKCIIVIGHHPRYSSGAHGDTPAISDTYDLMMQYGVEAYISGHDHHYERIGSPVPQYVVGTGGKDLRTVGRTVANSEFVTGKHHGILLMSIKGKTIDASFVSINREVMDSHSLTCS